MTALEGRVGALEGESRIVETWSQGGNWYRKWSDGWIEQGGEEVKNVLPGNASTITLHVPMSNTSYTSIVSGVQRTDLGWAGGAVLSHNRTSSSFSYAGTGTNSGDGSNRCFWYVCGY